MMRKLLLVVLILVFCGGMAIADMAVIARKNVASNTCPSGTYEFGYDGDHTSGADYCCYESGTANEQASAETADSVTSDYVQSDDSNEYLRFTITGDISADIDSLGTLFWEIYVVDDTLFGDSGMIEINYSADEQIVVYMDGANARIRCNHEGAAAVNNVLSGSKAVNTWYRCGYSWNAGTDYHCVKCVTSGSVTWGSPDDEDNETVDGFDDGGAVDPSTLVIGEDLSTIGPTDTWRIRDVHLVAGYKATDPGSL